MKIALCSSFVPFENGGYRNIVEWLRPMLEAQGHQVEIVYLPEVDEPDLLFQQMMAYRWVDLQHADRIICFRPQSHLIPHPHKILWFIHHIRSFYDLWDGPYRAFEDDQTNRDIRKALHEVDRAGLGEAKAIFTNSQVVSDRLMDFNGVNSEVLYPPVLQPERFRCDGFNDEIVCICRLEHHKRQHLLVEALSLTQTPVRLRLCGTSPATHYYDDLLQIIKRWDLSERVTLDNRWISEEEKVDQLANCLAAAYLPFDEDSYGYPCVEASHSSKPVLTTLDAGGVLELIQDGVNGYITEPAPQALAKAMDLLYLDRTKTESMGRNARDRLNELNISWARVLERLLA